MAKIEDLIAEKEFKNEIYEKKKLTYGNKAKTSASGRRASFRGVRTEYDFLSREEKKKLNSDVIVSNLNDIVIKKEQFDLCTLEKQKELLTHWRELYENKYIMEQMGIRGTNTFHQYIKKLDIPKKPRGGSRGNNGGRPKKAPIDVKQANATAKQAAAMMKQEKAPQITLELEEPVIQEQVIEKPIQQPINSILQTVEGLHLNYNGIYDAEQLSKIFTKLQLITEGEQCKYQLNISLSEKPQ